MQSTERLIDANGVQLCAQTFGDPTHQAMLLVAGTSCSMDWWPPSLCSMLAERGLFVIRYDQRDTGRSTHDEVGSPTYSLRDLVQDAVAVLDAYDVDVAHWVGFSQGGWVSQLAALDHADRVGTMTLVSSRPTGHGPADPDLPEVSDRLMAEWASAGPEPDWTDTEAVVAYLVDGERAVAAEPFDVGAARAIATNCVARARDLRASIANHPSMEQGPRWRDRLNEISTPTLVLHGAEDPLFPPGNATALASEIPGARLEILPGVGHELPPRVWGTAVGAVGALAVG